jgi:hypothetical protein
MYGRELNGWQPEWLRESVEVVREEIGVFEKGDAGKVGRDSSRQQDSTPSR